MVEEAQWEGVNMKATFLNHEKPLMTVILQCETPDVAIGRIRNAFHSGGEAFGLQVESLLREYQNEEVYRKLFSEMRGKPIYVTNYRGHRNIGRTDEELVEGLLKLADCGATLVDVMGDFYDPQPDEVAIDGMAIQKQMELIDKLHSKGVEVLMSSHVKKFTPAERVLEIAMEQKRRGADIAKIVTGAENMEQQIENLRITNLLKKELGIPFLFLSGGMSSIHRRLGMKLGCCMHLCVYEHDVRSTAAQPLLSVSKIIRDDMGF